MIVVNLMGRIGNQLFMYAYARRLQLDREKDEPIVIYDEAVGNVGWKNSLKEYPQINARYVSAWSELVKIISVKNRIGIFIYNVMYYKLSKDGSRIDHVKIRKLEERWKWLLELLGIAACESGFMEMKPHGKKIFLNGYFQSELYFKKYESIIKEEFNLKDDLYRNYKDLAELIDKNTVCISIKVEHNAGSEEYDVCTPEYYKKAIHYMIEKVGKPRFFICSDNVEYVKEHLIDTSQFDYFEQNKEISVELSLAMMSMCKYFIIGNTSFAWWAQYLSEYDDKVVIAPQNWKSCEQQIDIYQEEWIRM